MSLKDFLLSWGMIFVGVALNVGGIFLIKIKINELGALEIGSFRMFVDYFLALLKSPMVIIGGVFFVIASFPLVMAVSRMELAVAYPLSIALSLLFLVPLGIIFLGEVLNAYKIAAIVMVIISIYFFYK